MEFRLLGPLEVAENGRPISLGGSRARALLALLLLHRNQVLAVDRIVDELWAERPPKTGGQVVRVYVSHLRKALEPDRSEQAPRVLVTHRNGYLLRAASDEVDVDRFEALRAEGHRLLAGGEIADAARTLEEALSLWRGPPLQDFAYEAFAQQEIARLEELHLATLEDLFDAQLATGRDSELVAGLEQLVEANPLRERLRAQLMLALYRAGRPADALEAYQRGRRILVDELGLEPGETLRRLETRILQQDPELDRPNVAPTPTETPARPPPTRSRRMAMRGAAVVLLGVVATAGLVRVATAGHSQKQPPAASLRVTLVVSAARNPIDTSPALLNPINGLLRAAADDSAIQARVVYGGYQLSGFLRKIKTAARTPTLVIVDTTPNEQAVSKLTPQFPKTRFLVLDSVDDRTASFRGQRNVTGLSWDDRENAQVGGYLAGLMTRGHEAVSAVGGRRTQTVEDLIAGFTDGARAARPGIRVLVDYTNTFETPDRCEAAANRQMDHGSTVVFDAAGDCGFGALQAAGIRGVRGIGVDDDLSYLGPQIIGSIVKRSDRAIQLAVMRFASGQLPGGEDLRFDLASGNIGLVISNRVPVAVRDKVETFAAKLRIRDEARDSR